VFEEVFSFCLQDVDTPPRIEFVVKSVKKEEVLGTVKIDPLDALKDFNSKGVLLKDIPIQFDGLSTKGTLSCYVILKFVEERELVDLRKEEKKDEISEEEKAELERIRELEERLSRPMTIALESTAALFVSFFAGYFYGFSPLGLGFAACSFGTKFYYSYKRASAKYILASKSQVAMLAHIDRSANDDKVTGKLLQSLPEWVSDPSVEKNEWLNELLIALWPSVRLSVGKLVRANIEPLLEQYRPKFLSVLRLKILDVGDNAPLFSGVRAFPRRKVGQMTILDMDMCLANSCIIVIEVGTPLGVIPITVSDVSFRGVLRVKLYDLVGIWPCFASASVSFKDFPEVDFSLSIAGLPVMSIPGVYASVDHIIHNVVGNMLVWPHELCFPILDPGENAIGQFSPDGYVHQV
tara:strand:- start:1607 stop:2830 length:1224 start_codon:yes stop_codon:yes gene_type:complete